ncbi:MAG: hypothetical protein ACYSOF_08080 [Planctomycetota bacterium]|jgi:hypothetical protein
MSATKGFWKHAENGRIYAIECTPFGQIVGACGPLDPYNLPDLETIEYGGDILIWVESTMAEGKLRRFNSEPPKNPADPKPPVSESL